MTKSTSRTGTNSRTARGRKSGAARDSKHAKAPTAATELFGSQRKPEKRALSTYITVATFARLQEVVSTNGLSTTDVVETALARLFDEMGVPQADIEGNLTED